MELIVQNFEHASGFNARDVPVAVVGRDNDTAIDLFDNEAGNIAKTNPLTTDDVGNVDFYIPLGVYDYLVLGERIPFDVEASATVDTGAIEANVTTLVLAGLEPPVDLLVLFENALA